MEMTFCVNVQLEYLGNFAKVSKWDLIFEVIVKNKTYKFLTLTLLLIELWNIINNSS